jgi:outer membrane protein assembly factor BamB
LNCTGLGGRLSQSPIWQWRKLIWWGIVGLVALGLAGCGGGTPEMVWPGLNAVGDAVYVTSPDGRLKALEAASGKLRWEFPDPEIKDSPGLHATPVVTDGLLLIGSYVYNGANRLYALDSNSGQEKWSVAVGGPIVGSAAIGNGKVFVGASDNRLYCFETATGNPCWTSPFTAVHWIWSSPLLAGERVFMATMDHNLYCVDAAKGTPCWETPYKAVGALAGTPALADDTIYMGDFGGTVYAVSAATGQQKWAFEAGNWVWGGPVVAEGTVFFGTLEGKVYALDAASGQKKWELKVEGRVRASPSIASGLLYVGSEGGHLYAIDAATGQVRWDFLVPAGDDSKRRILTAPIASDGLVFTVSMDGQVYALDAANGTQKWGYPPASG